MGSLCVGTSAEDRIAERHRRGLSPGAALAFCWHVSHLIRCTGGCKADSGPDAIFPDGLYEFMQAFRSAHELPSFQIHGPNMSGIEGLDVIHDDFLIGIQKKLGDQFIAV